MKKSELKQIIKEEIINQTMGKNNVIPKITQNELVELLRKYGNIEIFTNGKWFMITDGMDENFDNKTFIAIDKEGQEKEIRYSDIEHINYI